ncbi:hypothetical protein FG87_35230 [Nocardia vulneris]|uniref:Uncharacterized protein n=1 Tax=Nocardia vulneris TaxID=1141657 RepID=A0ABR4Z603_9NOCA|nr:hypothetical protein FG87_35230 [Nocardia vulneris]
MCLPRDDLSRLIPRFVERGEPAGAPRTIGHCVHRWCESGLAERARVAYARLVHDTPGFVDSCPHDRRA